MSNTPNPQRKPRERTVKTTKVYKLFRNKEGSVLTPSGLVIERARYEKLWRENPELVPEIRLIPFAELPETEEAA